MHKPRMHNINIANIYFVYMQFTCMHAFHIYAFRMYSIDVATTKSIDIFDIIKNAKNAKSFSACAGLLVPTSVRFVLFDGSCNGFLLPILQSPYPD